MSAVTDVSSLRTQMPQPSREPLNQIINTAHAAGGTHYQNREILAIDKSGASTDTQLKGAGSVKKNGHVMKKKSGKQLHTLKNTNSKSFKDGGLAFNKPLDNPSECLNQSNLLLNSESNKNFNLNTDIERHNLNQNRSLRIVQGARTNMSNGDHAQI